MERLIHALEAVPDVAAREAARELTGCLLELHADWLRQVLALAGSEVVERLAGDEQLGSLLLLHGLHPRSAEERLNRGLECIRPRLRALGGGAELVQATETRVRLRLLGDPESGGALRSVLEEVVIAAVPDAEAVEFEEAWDRAPTGRVPLPLLPARRDH